MAWEHNIIVRLYISYYNNGRDEYVRSRSHFFINNIKPTKSNGHTCMYVCVCIF